VPAKGRPVEERDDGREARRQFFGGARLDREAGAQQVHRV
jgi:hypothetical protein